MTPPAGRESESLLRIEYVGEMQYEQIILLSGKRGKVTDSVDSLIFLSVILQVHHQSVLLVKVHIIGTGALCVRIKQFY